VAERRSIKKKNTKKTKKNNVVSFKSKTGIAFPETGVFTVKLQSRIKERDAMRMRLLNEAPKVHARMRARRLALHAKVTLSFFRVAFSTF